MEGACTNSSSGHLVEEGSTIWWTERQPSQVAWSGDEGLVWWRKQRLRGVARRAARQVAKPGANGGSGGAPGGARETRRVRQRHLDAGAALPLNASLAAPPADALAGERDSTKGVEMGSEAVQGGFGEAGPQAAAGETGAAGGEDPEEESWGVAAAGAGGGGGQEVEEDLGTAGRGREAWESQGSVAAAPRVEELGHHGTEQEGAARDGAAGDEDRRRPPPPSASAFCPPPHPSTHPPRPPFPPPNPPPHTHTLLVSSPIPTSALLRLGAGGLLIRADRANRPTNRACRLTWADLGAQLC